MNSEAMKQGREKKKKINAVMHKHEIKWGRGGREEKTKKRKRVDVIDIHSVRMPYP